jgi:hypothetical protein
MVNPIERYTGQFRKWMPGYLVTQPEPILVIFSTKQQVAKYTANNAIFKMMES